MAFYFSLFNVCSDTSQFRHLILFSQSFFTYHSVVLYHSLIEFSSHQPQHFVCILRVLSFIVYLLNFYSFGRSFGRSFFTYSIYEKWKLLVFFCYRSYWSKDNVAWAIGGGKRKWISMFCETLQRVVRNIDTFTDKFLHFQITRVILQFFFLFFLTVTVQSVRERERERY